LVLTGVVGLLLGGCEQGPADSIGRWTDDAAPAGTPTKYRWYTQEQVAAGAVLYREHCASCHKEDAEGTAEWMKRDAEGKFPPPPLNGTAHTWHHPRTILRRVVTSGGVPLGGSMPAFAGKLDTEQIDAILAWIQSHWSDEIYATWQKRDRQAR